MLEGRPRGQLLHAARAVQPMLQTMTNIPIAGTFRLAGVFSKTFAIYGRRFAPFIILTIIASIPGYVAVFAIVTGIEAAGKAAPFNIISYIRSMGPSGLYIYALSISVVVVLMFVLTQSLASAAVMFGVVQELRGQRVSIAGSTWIFLLRFLPMMGIAVCTTLLIGFGAVVLVVPGLILACMYYVSMPVCVAEPGGISASISRSILLTEGHRWQVFGTVVLLAAAALVLSIIVARVVGPAGPVWLLVAHAVLRVIINSFYGVLVSVFYYELRAEKEGVDIDKIASVFD
jgi:hypothetical protein